MIIMNEIIMKNNNDNKINSNEIMKIMKMIIIMAKMK